MNLDKNLDKFCKEMEIPNTLGTEVPGVFSLPLDEDFHILITAAPPGFVLSSELCAAPEKKAVEFAEEALIANVFGQATEGAVLGLSPAGDKVVLSREIDDDPEYQEFSDILEEFINAADFWRSETKQYA